MGCCDSFNLPTYPLHIYIGAMLLERGEMLNSIVAMLDKTQIGLVFYIYILHLSVLLTYLATDSIDTVATKIINYYSDHHLNIYATSELEAAMDCRLNWNEMRI